MKNYRLKIVIALCLLCGAAFGQGCFMEKKQEHDMKFSLPTLEVGDSIAADQTLALIRQFAADFVGCMYPTFYYTNSNGKAQNLSQIKTDITLVNFNYVYDDEALKQLNELDSLKKVFGNKISIVSVFDNKYQNELKPLTDKHSQYINIVSVTENAFNTYNAGIGFPETFVLDGNKIILHISHGTSEVNSFYNEILNYVK